MEKTKRLNQIIDQACAKALQNRNEFLVPEHLLWAISNSNEGKLVLVSYQCNPTYFADDLDKILCSVNNDLVPEGIDYELSVSFQTESLLKWATMIAEAAGKQEVDIPHVIQAMLKLEESNAKFYLQKNTTTDEAEFLSTVIAAYNGEEVCMHLAPQDEPEYDYDPYLSESEDSYMPSASGQNDSWRNLVTCINDQLQDHNPLIGREAELDRTIQVLCRKEKNNPLHIGEPGVGKTALVFGLAARIEAGNVPDKLQGARIYQMDMGNIIAGTTYRGEFEKKIKAVMDGVIAEGNAIVYIDEIHTLIGSGATGEGSMDGSNMLKPYLEGGQVRFIGSTTYQEYNRYFQKSKGMVRRFQQIDVPEPSTEEAIGILEGLRDKYETFHGVKYADGVLRYAVEASARLINDRFLPDKAIDLIDEAGAYRVMHPLMRRYRGELRRSNTQTIDKGLINEVLARVCKIDPNSLKDDDTQNLETLSDRLRGQIYGQDEAVRQVVEAVEMGKAGLLDDNKPIASLLFVGPTGVGKTEVCKVLAKELGIELVRFDMSEYTEKHTVAKLIGSPAGYVGYEDGGLLTDAIRRTPHCVLLLDEIEKAHSDIYNILLQVMDYARLTDNKGQKADFRHVILVMTSNAGAQFAHQASVGFGTVASSGQAMLSTVRKTFKPEFLARLSGTVVFNDMDRTMASMILDKKLRQLSDRLAARKVTMQLSEAAHAHLLQQGYNQRQGAREMDRVINQQLSPLLMREILYGRLRKGGHASIGMQDDKLTLEAK